MTYTELRQAIKDYTENFETTFDNNIPVFVKQAENRIFNTIQFPALRKNVTGNLTANNKYLATPADFLAVFSLAVINSSGEFFYLNNKDVNYIRENFPNPNTTGIAKVYALFDDNTFIIGPTPNASYATELHYFYYPTSIVTAGTSWLGTNFDSALLYGALLEAALFMKTDADTMTMYKARYDDAMAELKQLGDGKNRQDAYRSGQVRYPVR